MTPLSKSGAYPIDIKTVSKTKTNGIYSGGALAIFPSKDKHFSTPSFRIQPPIIMPSDLHAFLVSHKGKRNIGSQSPRSKTKPKSATLVPPAAQKLPDVEDIARCRILLPQLAGSRKESYSDWMNVGYALHNVSTSLLQDWIDWSSTSNKFDKGVCEDKWSTMNPVGSSGSYNLAHLESWAAEDGFSPEVEPRVVNDGEAEKYRDYIFAPPVLNQASLPFCFILMNDAHKKRLSFSQLIIEQWEKKDRGLAKIAHSLLSDYIKKCGTKDVFYFDFDLVAWRLGTSSSVRMMIGAALSQSLELLLPHYEALETPAPSTTSDYSSSSSNKSKRWQVLKLLDYVNTGSGLTSIVNLAIDLFRDDSFAETLDSIPNLVGVKNGVVNLHTGALRKREPADLLYRILNIVYDPDADTSLMADHILKAMAGNISKARFLKILLGYGITGEISEELFIIFTGSGRNGKGVISQLLAAIFGLFCVEMNTSLISGDQKISNIDAELVKINGARLAFFKETGSGQKLKTDRVQLLTGGDGIPCRALYNDALTIKPRHLCILETNNMPELVQPVLPSTIERIMVVHFPVTFTNLIPGEIPSKFRQQCDPTLKERLKSSLQGVFKWFVDGAVEYYATRNLKQNAPSEVLLFTNAYMLEQDLVQQFLEQRCEVRPGDKVGTAVFMSAFNNWVASTIEEKRAPARASDLAASMQAKGFVKRSMWINNFKVNGYDGVSILPVPCAIVE